MKLKAGVRLDMLQPQIVLAAVIVNEIYAAHETECIITSCNDSVHKDDSLHYSGNAIDVRTKNVMGDKNALRNEIASAVGADFDVILESLGENNEHLHIEYDPDDAAH